MGAAKGIICFFLTLSFIIGLFYMPAIGYAIFFALLLIISELEEISKRLE